MHIILVYLGILLGIFFEGEMTMLSSVVAAHNGYLNLWVVVTLGFIGTFASDCFFFYLGRKRGTAWLAKRPKYEKKANNIFQNLAKTPFLVFISYRFLYGFRSVAPVVIGTSKITTKKFLTFSIISILIWDLTYTILGYFLSNVIMNVLNHIQHIEKYIIGGLALVAVLLVIFRFLKKHDKQIKSDSNS